MNYAAKLHKIYESAASKNPKISDTFVLMKNVKLTLWLRQILPIALGVSVAAYLIIKAATVQVTCDEAFTMTIYPEKSVDRKSVV